MIDPVPDRRPVALAEVRAWILAAAVVFVHTISIVWWAATLSADLKSLKETLLITQSSHNSQELRIRALEREVAVLVNRKP
jgi:hypothetical protein